MTTPQTQERRPEGTRAALNSRLEACPEGTSATAERPAIGRPRCIRCGHPLTDPRSLSRGYGRRCWKRTLRNQIDDRRDAVGRRLRTLASRLPSIDDALLGQIADALAELDEVVAAGVRHVDR